MVIRTKTYFLKRKEIIDFFNRIFKEIPHKILLVIAYDEEGPVGSALNILDNDNLYGRYWGAIKYIPYLHFELCYYQGQEYCIENNLSIFEGGLKVNISLQEDSNLSIHSQVIIL